MKGVGDFHNVFKFHACSVNKKLFLTTLKLARACRPSNKPTANVHAKWLPAIEITLKKQVNEMVDYQTLAGETSIKFNIIKVA